MKITVTELRSTINSILAAHPIYGARQSYSDISERLKHGHLGAPVDLSLEWDQAWGVNARLRVRIDVEGGSEGAYGGRAPCSYFRTVCDIGWSGAGRDVQGATAAIALYQKVVQLAALIESATNNVKVQEEKAE